MKARRGSPMPKGRFIPPEGVCGPGRRAVTACGWAIGQAGACADTHMRMCAGVGGVMRLWHGACQAELSLEDRPGVRKHQKGDKLGLCGCD